MKVLGFTIIDNFLLGILIYLTNLVFGYFLSFKNIEYLFLFINFCITFTYYFFTILKYGRTVGISLMNLKVVCPIKPEMNKVTSFKRFLPNIILILISHFSISIILVVWSIYLLTNLIIYYESKDKTIEDYIAGIRLITEMDSFFYQKEYIYLYNKRINETIYIKR